MSGETLTITDNRTGKQYELPIENGTIKAMDLRQIKTTDEDFGLMTYDPAFMNTASCKSRITFIDGDRGILEYRGYPIDQLAERSTYLEVAYLLLHGELPTEAELKDWTWNITYHTFINENIKKVIDGFHYNAHPMGMFEATLGALISLESSWTIVPRYQEGAVAEYDTSELPALISRCVAHLPWAAPDKSDDLYLIGKSGTALIAYDHHGLDDGMPIFLLNTESAEDFLTVLNQRGAEFELFSRDG